METAEAAFRRNKLGRKHIESLAGGIAQIFAGSAQHCPRPANQDQMPSVTIDLPEMQIEPAEFDGIRNHTHAGMFQRTFLRNTRQLTPPGVRPAKSSPPMGKANRRASKGVSPAHRGIGLH
jgi:hypothetical protein